MCVYTYLGNRRVRLAAGRVFLKVTGTPLDIVLHAAREVALVGGLVEFVALPRALGNLLSVARPLAGLGRVPVSPLHVAVAAMLQVCVCVCVERERERERERIYRCILCVSVCVRARARVCVCMYICTYVHTYL